MKSENFGKNKEETAEYIFKRYNNPLVTMDIAYDLIDVIKTQLNFCNNVDSIIDYSSFLNMKQLEQVYMEDLSYFSFKDHLTTSEKLDKIIEDDDETQLYKINDDIYLFFNPTKE